MYRTVTSQLIYQLLPALAPAYSPFPLSLRSLSSYIHFISFCVVVLSMRGLVFFHGNVAYQTHSRRC